MLYAIVSGEKIIEVIDSDRQAKPPGAILLTIEQAETIKNSRYGFSEFNLVNGELVKNNTFIDELTLVQTRNKKKTEIRKECLKRIAGINDTLADDSNLALVVALVKAGFSPSAGSDIALSADIYRYARIKILQADTATQEQLDNYDPATDTNWP